MANSKYEYVRGFERDNVILPNMWIVVRIDGRGFHKLSKYYNFTKPNDLRAINLMNAAASKVMQSLPDLCIAYGVSDEFSFVLHKSTTLFERREAKLTSTVVSGFTAAYVALWGQYSGDQDDDGGEKNRKDKGERNETGGDREGERQVGRESREGYDAGKKGKGGRQLDMDMLPTFDARVVCFPTLANLRDYLSWRQVDCHINNLYNTTFWTMLQTGGMTPTAAEQELKGTLAADKNEILWSRFQVNYNDELEVFRKGSVLFREYVMVEQHDDNDAARVESGMRRKAEGEGKKGGDDGYGDENEDEENNVMTDNVNGGESGRESKTQREKMRKIRQKAKVVVVHLDIIKDDFWRRRPWILSGRPGKLVG